MNDPLLLRIKSKTKAGELMWLHCFKYSQRGRPLFEAAHLVFCFGCVLSLLIGTLPCLLLQFRRKRMLWTSVTTLIPLSFSHLLLYTAGLEITGCVNRLQTTKDLPSLELKWNRTLFHIAAPTIGLSLYACLITSLFGFIPMFIIGIISVFRDSGEL